MQVLTEQLAVMSLPQGCGRIFHGRGGRFPGAEHLCLDWFEPVLLLTSFKQLSDAELAPLLQAVTHFWQMQRPTETLNLVYQYRAGGQTHTQLVCGSVPEPHIVTEHGNRFMIHLLRGQNHGLFLDMSAGRAWVQAMAQGKRVLNLFSYTCGFSVAAMMGGAEKVVNIDMAKGALSIGKQNHQLNGIKNGVSFLGHDIFKSWGKLRKAAPFDLIVADPPSNQKGSFVATKDYARLLRKLPELLSEQGELLLCLNAPELDCAFLQQQVVAQAPQLQFIERVANPAVFADIDEEKSLKVLRYRISH
ncbi:S-adenosylmethionine-dependent methyltransferase [Shewanella sp. NFH-SH190041]|uniref:class I SAM-dependent methyltransferase n=1 Tax=Shewanella sp. NFH-SH190041 TaxID=2950245 RepID=UPI0021C301F9|nr:class I SAM-dependent methyltransferase [Shewanella sp. NFH-SH190041]BDM64737.1 S-adenosylmethionine-dependent methyltransferase [Shewanella sp. NFH-SH190041]